MAADPQQLAQQQRQAAASASQRSTGISKLAQLQIRSVQRLETRRNGALPKTVADLKLPESGKFAVPEAVQLTADEQVLWNEIDHAAEASAAFDQLMTTAQSQETSTETYQHSVDNFIAKQTAAFNNYEFQVEKALHDVKVSEQEIARLHKQTDSSLSLNPITWVTAPFEKAANWATGFNAATDKAIEVEQKLLEQKQSKLAELQAARTNAENQFAKTMHALDSGSLAAAQEYHATMQINLTKKAQLSKVQMQEVLKDLQSVSEGYTKAASRADTIYTIVQGARDVALVAGAITAAALLTPILAPVIGTGILAYSAVGFLGGLLSYGVCGTISYGVESVALLATKQATATQALGVFLGGMKSNLFNAAINGLPIGFAGKVFRAVGDVGHSVGLLSGLTMFLKAAGNAVAHSRIIKSITAPIRYLANTSPGHFLVSKVTGVGSSCIMGLKKYLVSPIHSLANTAPARFCRSIVRTCVGKCIGVVKSCTDWAMSKLAKVATKISEFKSYLGAKCSTFAENHTYITACCKGARWLALAPFKGIIATPSLITAGLKAARDWYGSTVVAQVTREFFAKRVSAVATRLNYVFKSPVNTTSTARGFLSTSGSRAAADSAEHAVGSTYNALAKISKILEPTYNRAAANRVTAEFTPQLTREVAHSQIHWWATTYGTTSSFLQNSYSTFWDTTQVVKGNYEIDGKGNKTLIDEKVISVSLTRPELAERSFAGKLLAISYESVIDGYAARLSAGFGVNAAIRTEFSGMMSRLFHNTIGGSKAVLTQTVASAFKQWDMGVLLTADEYKRNLTMGLTSYLVGGQFMNDAIAARHAGAVRTRVLLENHVDNAVTRIDEIGNPIQVTQPNTNGLRSRQPDRYELNPSPDFRRQEATGRVPQAGDRTLNAEAFQRQRNLHPDLPARHILAQEQAQPIVDALANRGVRVVLQNSDSLATIDSSIRPGVTRDLSNYDSAVRSPLESYLRARGINLAETDPAVLANAINRSGILRNPITPIATEPNPNPAQPRRSAFNDDVVDAVVRNLNTDKLQRYALRSESQAEPLTDLAIKLQNTPHADRYQLRLKELVEDKADGQGYHIERLPLTGEEGQPRYQVVVDGQQVQHHTLAEIYAQVRYEQDVVVPAQQLSREWGRSWTGLGDFSRHLSPEQRLIIRQQHQELENVISMGEYLGLDGNDPIVFTNRDIKPKNNQPETAEGRQQNKPRYAPSLHVAARGEMGLSSPWSELKRYYLNQSRIDYQHFSTDVPASQWTVRTGEADFNNFAAMPSPALRFKAAMDAYHAGNSSTTSGPDRPTAQSDGWRSNNDSQHRDQIRDDRATKQERIENYIMEQQRLYFKGNHELDAGSRDGVDARRYPRLNPRADDVLPTRSDIDTPLTREELRALSESIETRAKEYRSNYGTGKRDLGKMEETFADNFLRREKSGADRTFVESVKWESYQSRPKADLSSSEKSYYDRLKYDRPEKVDASATPEIQAKQRESQEIFVANRLMALRDSGELVTLTGPNGVRIVSDAQIAQLGRNASDPQTRIIARNLIERYTASERELRICATSAKDAGRACALDRNEQIELATLKEESATIATHNRQEREAATAEGRRPRLQRFDRDKKDRLNELSTLQKRAEKLARFEDEIKQKERSSGNARGNAEVSLEDFSSILDAKTRTSEELAARPNYNPNDWAAHAWRFIRPMMPWAPAANYANNLDDTEDLWKARWWLQHKMQQLRDWNLGHGRIPQHLATFSNNALLVGSGIYVADQWTNTPHLSLLQGWVDSEMQLGMFGNLPHAIMASYANRYRDMMRAMGDNYDDTREINQRNNLNLLTVKDDHHERKKKGDDAFNEGAAFVAPAHYHSSGHRYGRTAEDLEADGWFVIRSKEVMAQIDAFTKKPEYPLFNMAENAQSALHSLTDGDPMKTKYYSNYTWSDFKIVPKDPEAFDTSAQSTVHDYVVVVPPVGRFTTAQPLVMDATELKHFVDQTVLAHGKGEFATAQKQLIERLRELPEDNWIRKENFDGLAWNEAEIITDSFGMRLAVPHIASTRGWLESLFSPIDSMEALLFPIERAPKIYNLDQIRALSHGLKDGEESWLRTQ